MPKIEGNKATPITPQDGASGSGQVQSGTFQDKAVSRSKPQQAGKFVSAGEAKHPSPIKQDQSAALSSRVKDVKLVDDPYSPDFVGRPRSGAFIGRPHTPDWARPDWTTPDVRPRTPDSPPPLGPKPIQHKSLPSDVKKSTLEMLAQGKELVTKTQAYINEFQSDAMAVMQYEQEQEEGKKETIFSNASDAALGTLKRRVTEMHRASIDSLDAQLSKLAKGLVDAKSTNMLPDRLADDVAKQLDELQGTKSTLYRTSKSLDDIKAQVHKSPHFTREKIDEYEADTAIVNLSNAYHKTDEMSDELSSINNKIVSLTKDIGGLGKHMSVGDYGRAVIEIKAGINDVRKRFEELQKNAEDSKEFIGRLRRDVDEYAASKAGSQSFTEPQATGASPISFGATPVTEVISLNHIYEKTVEQNDRILGEIKGYESRLSQLAKELSLTRI